MGYIPTLMLLVVLAVGREGVLASSHIRELRCGSRLVSGLFSRPKLPLGYSYVTTVPRGACRINISEIMPSDNYIALKLTNGSYIMNGEFAVSSPGSYEAAGARFMYSRSAGLDSIFALGPIHHEIDIMVLCTQPNHSIKYEYLSGPETDETSNDIPTAGSAHHQTRHHHRYNTNQTKDLDFFTFRDPMKKQLDRNSIDDKRLVETNVIGSRKFTWKILEFTQCSRSCGGGLQIGKFKCVEETPNLDVEVSSVHCTGAAPPTRRRRCGGAPCAPRWRAAAWGPCPVCGPAYRTRIVGCVQDHLRGITKISDLKCPLPMPPNKELCEIPNCDGTRVTTISPRPDVRRQVRPIDRIDSFHEGPVISLASNTTKNDIKAGLKPSYVFNAAGGWLYTEWSPCVGWCLGGGLQTRAVRCNDPSGCASRVPVITQTCNVVKQCNPQWFAGEWSSCSAPCDGRQIRAVICLGGNNGRRLRDTSCNKATKPETERNCGGKCSTSWYLSDWGECQGPCEAGVQTRTVWCAKSGVDGASGAARDTECPGVRPAAKRSCVPARCSTKPTVKLAVLSSPAVSDSQQRVTRHQNTQHNRDRPAADGACIDKLNNCVLAVQARLCHYPYYADYCCQSCHGR